MRFDRMSGLGAEQLDELEWMVDELLEKPWDKGRGRPGEFTLREAVWLDGSAEPRPNERRVRDQDYPE